ncbi:hypothetical protein CPLU01_10117 [Colletotrichum plurivorum]|uniref:Uncharacterized protein n=1 Tax=Colletotrichum plurivorum TaxID=2175906 RepID=A0A8H6N9Z9_9PEZI|nr:hypothetical protein CPLU01_10117 [Colletotrichum plurivorum]
MQLRGPAQQPLRDTAVFLRADDIAEAERLEKAGRAARTTTDARRSSGQPARQRSRQRASWGERKDKDTYKSGKRLLSSGAPSLDTRRWRTRRCRSRRRSGDRIEVASSL